MKFAISGGIGLFIAFLGLSQGGLIVANDATLVGLGPLNVGSTWVTIVGLVVTAILLVRRVPGGIFIGMAISTIVGLATGVIPMPDKIISSAKFRTNIFSGVRTCERYQYDSNVGRGFNVPISNIL